MSISYTWAASDDPKITSGIATYYVGESEFKIELKSFNDAVMVDIMLQRKYDVGRGDIIREVKNLLNNVK